MCSCQKNENYTNFQCDRKKYDLLANWLQLSEVNTVCWYDPCGKLQSLE